MRKRDHESIIELYYVHRFLPSSIARLYGISHVTVLNIVKKNRDISFISDTECLLCGLGDAFTFYIDGNHKNKEPQNVIMLCEADKRRIRALQLRKRKGSVTPQL